MKNIFSKIILLSIFNLCFLQISYANSCENLFKNLDKQSRAISNADRNKQLIAIENDLFKAIDECRTYSGMFVLMGEVQIEMGQVPLAVVYGRKSVELDPQYWRAHKLLGTSRMLNKEVEAGLIALYKALELDPENTNVKLNLVSALVENKEYDKALKLVNSIIELNDHSILATAYFLRSEAYKGKGLIIEADKDSQRAKKLGFALR